MKRLDYLSAASQTQSPFVDAIEAASENGDMDPLFMSMLTSFGNYFGWFVIKREKGDKCRHKGVGCEKANKKEASNVVKIPNVPLLEPSEGSLKLSCHFIRL